MRGSAGSRRRAILGIQITARSVCLARLKRCVLAEAGCRMPASASQVSGIGAGLPEPGNASGQPGAPAPLQADRCGSPKQRL
jgi:hypothetical protein